MKNEPADEVDRGDMLIDRFERRVLSAARAFAMIVWIVVGAPVWIILICVALAFIFVVTCARVLTWREYSVDRRVLGSVLGFYPRGLRSVKREFAKIRLETEEPEDKPQNETSYIYSTFQCICLALIALAAYCSYARIEIPSLMPYVPGAFIVLFAVAALAVAADWRRARKKAQSRPPT